MPPATPQPPYLSLHVVPGLLQAVLTAGVVVLDDLGHNVTHVLFQLQWGGQGPGVGSHLWSHLSSGMSLPTPTNNPGWEHTPGAGAFYCAILTLLGYFLGTLSTLLSKLCAQQLGDPAPKICPWHC